MTQPEQQAAVMRVSEKLEAARWLRFCGFGIEGSGFGALDQGLGFRALGL